MLFDYATALVFLAFGVVFVLISITISKVLAPQKPNVIKTTPYECGEEPVGTPWIRFNPRYYLYALIFLIFDVEIAFMFPATAIYKDWVERGWGVIALFEIVVFVGILMVGLIYTWRKGDLTWVKTITRKP